MVTAALSDALSHPIEVIRQLHAQHASSSTSTPFAQVVETHFRELFQSGTVPKVPTLDVTHPPSSYPSGSLVRFRAMVQDTSQSPEIYLSHLGYGLDAHPPSHVNGTANEDGQEAFGMRTLQDALDAGVAAGQRARDQWRERSVFWAVSVPGESEWVSNFLESAQSPAIPTTTAPSTTSMAHKYPLPSTSHVGALVKSYTSAEFKPSTTYDFLGILTFDPKLSPLDTSETEEPEGEEILLPSVHVLFCTPLPATLVKAAYPMPPARGRTRIEVKEEIVSWLADSALGGDLLAAEHVLLCCIARMQSRSPFLPPPTLLLSHFPPSSAPVLQKCLSLLFPLVAHIPLSIKYLNTNPFAPSSNLKDDSEDLRSGVLQLAPGTVVLVDESGIGEGKLEDQGVRNIGIMQSVMTTQTLGYMFPFSSYEFPTDLGFVVLSEGSKSPFFQTDINLPLRPTHPTQPEEPLPLSPEQIGEYRLWLAAAKTQAASRNSVPIPADMASYIQSEFVRERKESEAAEKGKGMTGDELSLRMTLTKLESYLRHDSEITQEAWDAVVALGKERKSRSTTAGRAA